MPENTLCLRITDNYHAHVCSYSVADLLMLRTRVYRVRNQNQATPKELYTTSNLLRKAFETLEFSAMHQHGYTHCDPVPRPLSPRRKQKVEKNVFNRSTTRRPQNNSKDSLRVWTAVRKEKALLNTGTEQENYRSRKSKLIESITPGKLEYLRKARETPSAAWAKRFQINLDICYVASSFSRCARKTNCHELHPPEPMLP